MCVCGGEGGCDEMIFENSVIFAEFSVKPKSDLKSNIIF